MAAVVEQLTDAQYKRTLRALLAGREVALEQARAAIKWLRADVTVIEATNGNVRLRVPVHPRSATDLRAGRSASA
jgi:hypothetical protein